MSSLVLESGLAALGFARWTTTKLLENLPENKWCHQVTPNANHALWVLGHIAWTDDSVLVDLGGRSWQCDETYRALFAMKSTPVADPARYPSIATVRDFAHGIREELSAWFQGMSEEKLAAPTPTGWEFFAPTFAALMSSLACHEALHAGQITVIRKALGMTPLSG
jgi:hypothetical protein